MDIGTRAVIPPHLAPGQFIYFSADNIYINDGTLDGKQCHTLHATLCTTWQRGSFHVDTLKSMTPAKHVTSAVPWVMNTIFKVTSVRVQKCSDSKNWRSAYTLELLIGQHMQYAGLNVMWIESDLLGENTTLTEHAMAGKDYSKAKGTRAHKITIQAM